MRDDRMELICRACSNPRLSRLTWWRDERRVSSVQEKIIDEHCEEIRFQVEHFARYECRGENLLGRNSDFVDLLSISSSSVVRVSFAVLLLSLSVIGSCADRFPPREKSLVNQ